VLAERRDFVALVRHEHDRARKDGHQLTLALVIQAAEQLVEQ
jgi:hypothetical protein